MFKNNDKFIKLYSNFILFVCMLIPLASAMSIIIGSYSSTKTAILIVCNLIPVFWFYWEYLKSNYDFSGLFSLIPAGLSLLTIIISLVLLKKYGVDENKLYIAVALLGLVIILMAIWESVDAFVFFDNLINCIVKMVFIISYVILLFILSNIAQETIYLSAIQSFVSSIAILISCVLYYTSMLFCSICIDIKLIRNKLYGVDNENNKLTHINSEKSE